MRISPVQTLFSPSFGTKNKDVRKADEIERKTKEVFPMISPTYIDSFFVSAKYGSKSRRKAERVSDRLQSQIMALRDIAKYPSYSKIKIPEVEKSTLYAINLNGIKQLKAGNCMENAMAAMAVLCANGYYNSERVELCLKGDFVDKKTGETVFSLSLPMDHSFAVTDMNSRDEKDIVIDPWLGFAGSKSEAIARFKQIYSNADIYELTSIIRSSFRCRMMSENINTNFNDYEMKTEFIFRPTEPYTTDYQKKRLGEYARAMFDGIVIDEKGSEGR